MEVEVVDWKIWMDVRFEDMESILWMDVRFEDMDGWRW